MINGKDKKKSNNRGSKRKGHRRKDEMTMDKEPNQSGSSGALSSLNDISWYKRYPELLDVASRIPFPVKPGMKMDLGNAVGVDTYVPGVMTMKWIPAIGEASTPTSPINIAAKEIYAKVRSKFSGSLDADAPDFIVYLLSLDSMFSYIGALKRVYRILDAYTPYNYVIPQGLLQAMGFTNSEIQNLRTNRANFNLIINELVKMSQKFMLPATMDYFNRHYWLNDNVYADANSAQAQMYVFIQEAFFKYNNAVPVNGSTTVTAGGCNLVAAPWSLDSTATITVDSLYQFGKDLIDSIAEGDDNYTISGYLMRAYEGAPQFRAEPIGIDEVFAPVYVPEVLAQIENAHGIAWSDTGSISNLIGTTVQQSVMNNTVVWDPMILATSASGMYPDTGTTIQVPSPYMSLRSDNPTSDEVVLATRLKTWTDSSTTTVDGKAYYKIHAATEIVLNWDVWTYGNFFGSSVSTVSPDWIQFGYSNEYTFRVLTLGDWNAAKAPRNVQQLYAMLLLSTFDWAPIGAIAVFMNPATGTNDRATGFRWSFYGDIHNVTTFTLKQLDEINRVCVYSEFNAFSE